MDKIPHIIILAYNEINVKGFLKYLEDKFEFLEYYENSDSYRIIYNDKNVSEEKNDFIFRNEAKIRIANKYYSAEVIVSSCIVKTRKKENEDENEEENKEKENEKKNEKEKNERENERGNEEKNGEKNGENEEKNEGENKEENKGEKELNAKKILYECIIFLFDNFNIEEKILINGNPFRSYDDDCLEYIKDPLTKIMIKNEEYDTSNLYKDIGIKIAILPLSFQKSNKEITNFFSEYFIESLFINYKLDSLNEENSQKSSKKNFCEKLKEKKGNKLEDYYEDNEERIVEALHCHMWKGLERKKRNEVILNYTDTKEKIKKDIENEEDVKENKNIRNNEIIKKNENIKDNENSKREHNIKEEKNIKSNENNDTTEDKNADLFIQNFNKIVEKIRSAKSENKNYSDSLRRKKAEELIFELQQYFCDLDDE